MHLAAVNLLLKIGGDLGGTMVQDANGNIALHYTEDLADCEEVGQAQCAASRSSVSIV